MKLQRAIVSIRWLLILSLGAIGGWAGVSGCGALPTATPAPTIPPSPTSVPTVTPMPTKAPQVIMSPVPSGAEKLVEQAKADLSRRLGRSADTIQVKAVDAVEWRDSSLGCPVEGMMYAQVLVPGFRILLQADGQIYEYHSSLKENVIYCARPRPPVGSEQHITFRRSGGFAGKVETFDLYDDGRIAVSPGSQPLEGNALAMEQLLKQIAATGLYDVAPGEFLPKNTCCDRFIYELTIVREGKTYTYTTIDAAENAPPALVKTLALIQDYIAKARR